MEGDRHVDESHGFDDGLAAFVDHSFAKDDEWPGNEKRNGTNATTNECQQSGTWFKLIILIKKFHTNEIIS